jgi:large subunit ribosomal protein L5e
MPFVAVQKNKAYYKRIQTKFRRRREGKTDYYARRKLVAQDKNKYNSPKFRLVARITNKRIICQIIYATIKGDRVLTQATSTELEKFDVPAGYTNYAACYATGLLIARRALDLVGLADSIKGQEEANAEEFHVEDEDNERKPFKVILDCGLIRTIPGSRVFGILKGAVDGGLHIPHSVAKFPGYVEPEEKGQDYTYDAEAHAERIKGVHVQEYMEMLKEEDPERYKIAFSKFIEGDKEEDLETMYTDCHAAIRENPKFEKKAASGITNQRNGDQITTSKGTTYTRKIKRSYQQRKARVAQKMENARAKLLAGMEEEEEEE